MKKRYYIALNILLAIIAAGNIFGSWILNGAYKEQVNRSEQAAQVTPTPAPTPTPTPTPVPTRSPREGDICKNFPDYDTGVNAYYSYQSDEVRIAITKHIQFPEAYFVADIWIRNIEAFGAPFAFGEFRPSASNGVRDPLEIAKENNAILSTNSVYFHGFLIRDGEIYRNKRDRNSACILYKDGHMESRTLEWNETADSLVANGAWDVWAFGPVLVQEGKACDFFSSSGRHPRTAIGYYEPGHYCLVVADGRQKDYAAGLSEDELAGLMESLGVQFAYNLDGGSSSQMLFKDTYVNSPAPDLGDTRLLPEMICIHEPVFDLVSN